MNSAKTIQSTWWNVPSVDRNTGEKITLREKINFLTEAYKVGGYIPPNLATHMLGVSRQYVQQLMNEGKLKTRVWHGLRFIEGDSFIDILEQRYSRKGGNPQFASLRRLSRNLKKVSKS